MSDGFVHLVGAGPGDPGLLTVCGRELLATCDAIVHDALANPAIVAEARAANPRVELHDVGKRGGSDASASQGEIDALLVRLARQGKRVVRLKGGDPFVFGRGSEEAEALVAAGIGYDVVPGVTAGIAAPAYAGIPVTHRGIATSVTFVTGHEDPAKGSTTTDWSALARAGGTIVLYMAVKALPRIVDALVSGGLSPDTPAAAVQWGTHPRQRTVVATLSSLAARLAEEGIGAPVITIVGRVVSLRETIGWFERRPLFGRRIVVTRARSQASSLAARFRGMGAEVIEAPATIIEPVDAAPLRSAVERVASYDWLLLTSQNAVAALWEVLRATGRDARALAGVKIAAVGPSTAASLLERGIAVDLTPARFVAEGLLEALREGAELRGARVLYVAAAGARDVLPRGLRESGATVDFVEAYRSVPDRSASTALGESLERGEVDVVTFTSAGAVAATVDAVGPGALRRARLASIGPVTSAALRQADLDPGIEADQATIEGLAASVARALAPGLQR